MFQLTNSSWTKLSLYSKNRKKNKKNGMKLDLRAKVKKIDILLYVQPHPLGILTFNIGRRDFSLHLTVEKQNVVTRRLLYICIYNICIYIYNLWNLFMIALQYDLWLVTVQWYQFLFKLFLKNLCWRDWSK